MLSVSTEKRQKLKESLFLKKKKKKMTRMKLTPEGSTLDYMDGT